MITNYGLATLNAVLNGTALLCVICGALAIYRRKIAVHKRWMLAAFVLSVVFLVSYATRIITFGDTHFPGTGAVRYAYLVLLISHVGLALIIAPFVLFTVILGLQDKRGRHKKWAPRVLPVWMYVLATGVLVYLALHHWN